MDSDIDFSLVSSNPFWKRKLRKWAEVQDVDKSGDISRADAYRIIENYKAHYPPEKVELSKKLTETFMENIGLIDDTVILSFEETVDKIAENLHKNYPTFKPWIEGFFRCIDLNNDGYISLEEWLLHNKCFSIDPEHARVSFDVMDQNKDGIISFEEFSDFQFEFIYTAENKLGSAILFGPLEP